MNKKQQVEQLMYKRFLYPQIGLSVNIVKEVLSYKEVMFSEALNRKLKEWLITTGEICSTMSDMLINSNVCLEDLTC